MKFYNLKNIYYIYKINVMTKEKIQSSSYPKKQPSYNAWCKKFKVGSRIQKFEKKTFYGEGEYDYDKFIKMIQNYGEDKQQKNIWKQVGETFFMLCKGQVQKARNKISIA